MKKEKPKIMHSLKIVDQYHFKNVPSKQQKLFFDFQKNHPYSTISVQNKKLEYIVSGKGERTLVFLHGALVKLDMWFYPITKLEDKFRIIAPLFPSQMMGAQEATDFISSILKKENIPKATFIGYSYGGGVAQYFAEKHPDLVDRLVLSHTGILGRENSINQLKKFRRVVKFSPLFLIKMKLKKRIKCISSSKWNEFHKAYFARSSSELTKRILLDYSENMLKLECETQNFPTDKRKWKGETIVLGTRDDKDAFKYFEKLSNLYPNSKDYIFKEKGGHHMLFLFPEKYTQVLTKFLL